MVIAWQLIAITAFTVLVSLGRYLSFLTFFGVMVLSPLVVARWFGGRQPRAWLQLVMETLAAQLMTLPLIVFIFGQASLVAPLANSIVLPLIPLAMLLTFVAGIAGMAIMGIAAWIAWPALAVLTFVVIAIERLADLPWAATRLSLTTTQLVLIYGLLLLIIIAIHRRLDKTRLNTYTIIE